MIHIEVPQEKLKIGFQQESVLGHLLFNIVINDGCLINLDSEVCNFADDNTVSLGQPTRLFSRRLLCICVAKSSEVLCCGQTTRHFTIPFIHLSNFESCLHRKFFPFATTTSKTRQKSADFYDKMECDRRKQLYLKIYQSVSLYFIKVNEKRRLERATLRMLVRKLILKMHVGL